MKTVKNGGLMTIVNKHGEWECPCGNVAEYDGFYPCNDKGEEVEPDTNWSLLYICRRCGKIYDNDGNFIEGLRIY